jgi:hypothetical protein
VSTEQLGLLRGELVLGDDEVYHPDQAAVDEVDQVGDGFAVRRPPRPLDVANLPRLT